MAILFTLRVFARNLLRGNRRRNTFRISFWCLAWDSNRGFSSNKPTHYLLGHGDLMQVISQKKKKIQVIDQKMLVIDRKVQVIVKNTASRHKIASYLPMQCNLRKNTRANQLWKLWHLKNAHNIHLLANLEGEQKYYKFCEANVLEATKFFCVKKRKNLEYFLISSIEIVNILKYFIINRNRDEFRSQ